MKTAPEYNPFSQPLLTFPPEELSRLKTTVEGWVVDYKVAGLKPDRFGKHMSAFANQFGGWLFIGVEESETAPYVAKAFPGIENHNVESVLNAIRDGASKHVSPPIYFEPRVIDGPVEKIGLPAGRSIVVVNIPEGPNPPYLHSGGQIYRRQGDASEPKPETDRVALDLLWSKSREMEGRLRDFVMAPTIRGALDDRPICFVYLLENPSLRTPLKSPLTLSQFKDSMEAEVEAFKVAFPLSNVFGTQNGFIARHTNGRYHVRDELTSFRWWTSGNVLLTLPLQWLEPETAAATLATQKRAIDKRFAETAIRSVAGGRLLDLESWMAVLYPLAAKYVHLRKTLGSQLPLWVKVAFCNVAGDTPYTAMPSYLDLVEANGIPICQDNLLLFPSTSETTLFPIPVEELSLIEPFRLANGLVYYGLSALGIAPENVEATFYGELVRAVLRGAGMQEEDSM